MTLLTVSLSPEVENKLREPAAAVGQDLSEHAAQILEHAARTPAIDEILGPFRRQVSESGMSDDQLDAFHGDLLERTRRDRKTAP